MADRPSKNTVSVGGAVLVVSSELEESQRLRGTVMQLPFSPLLFPPLLLLLFSLLAFIVKRANKIRVIHLIVLVVMAGGDYFFLLNLIALKGHIFLYFLLYLSEQLPCSESCHVMSCHVISFQLNSSRVHVIIRRQHGC